MENNTPNQPNQSNRQENTVRWKRNSFAWAVAWIMEAPWKLNKWKRRFWEKVKLERKIINQEQTNIDKLHEFELFVWEAVANAKMEASFAEKAADMLNEATNSIENSNHRLNWAIENINETLPRFLQGGTQATVWYAIVLGLMDQLPPRYWELSGNISGLSLDQLSDAYRNPQSFIWDNPLSLPNQLPKESTVADDAV